MLNYVDKVNLDLLVGAFSVDTLVVHCFVDDLTKVVIVAVLLRHVILKVEKVLNEILSRAVVCLCITDLTIQVTC